MHFLSLPMNFLQIKQFSLKNSINSYVHYLLYIVKKKKLFKNNTDRQTCIMYIWSIHLIQLPNNIIEVFPTKKKQKKIDEREMKSRRILQSNNFHFKSITNCHRCQRIEWMNKLKTAYKLPFQIWDFVFFLNYFSAKITMDQQKCKRKSQWILFVLFFFVVVVVNLLVKYSTKLLINN